MTVNEKDLQRSVISRDFLGGFALLGLLALFKLLLHLLVNGQYGYFRDELSYFDDAKRLDWGYVDHPPLTPLLGSIEQVLSGSSLLGFRLFPALTGAATIFVSGLIVRELGGGKFAQLLAALCVLVSPASLVLGVLFQAVPFEVLFWTIVCYLLVRLLKSDKPKLWLWIGVMLGLSLLNKYSILFYIAALAFAIIATPARKYLKSSWLWLGVLLAGLIFSPNLIWLIQHNFISLEYTRSINARDVSIGRADGFIPEQFSQITNPLTVPIWLAGLYFFLFKDKRFRPLGIIYLVVLVLFIILRGRSYYLAPAYPVLLAGGAFFLEKWFSLHSRLKYAYTGLLIVAGLIFVPLVLPTLPIGSDGMKTAVSINDALAEMIGWEELVADTAQVYRSLPPDEQANTLIYAGNYGEAGAISMYGPKYNLPRAISPVNSYYYWSQQNGLDASTYILLGYVPRWMAEWQSRCGELKQVLDKVSNPYNIKNEESYYSIYLCRNPKPSLSQLWPSLQRFS